MKSKENSRKKLKTALTCLIVVLVISCAGVTAYQILENPAGRYALIYQDGNLIRKIDLQEQKKPYEFTVEYVSGTVSGYNTILVKQGKIGISDANCPDKTCKHMGMIYSPRFPITCLPHKLVIEIVDEIPEENGLDAITH